jgi:hypothetical protein
MFFSGKYIKSKFFLRYAGEACTSNADCSLTNGSNCTNSVCTGAKQGDTCSVDADCLVGNYCNGTVCQAQLKQNANCTREFECVNGNACWNKTCTRYFSLPVGSDVSAALTDSVERQALCQFNLMNNDKCDAQVYNNMTEQSSSGLVTCNHSVMQQCNYTWSGANTTFTQDCVCGNNADGLSYCPKSHDSKFLK